MTVAFTPRRLRRIRGVRAADKATNRMSFSGVVPWFDLENLMGAMRCDGASFEGIVEVESLLEHDFVVVTRVDGITRKIRPQPCRLKWFDPRNQVWRVYTPDFELLQSVSKEPLYVEVKPERIAQQLEAEHTLIRRNFALLGCRFEVRTEVDIRAQPRFRNAELLFEHTAPMEDVTALDRVREVLHDAGPTVPTVGEVCRAAGIGGGAFAALLRLHVRGEIRFDLDREIDHRALILQTVRSALHPTESRSVPRQSVGPRNQTRNPIVPDRLRR